MCQNKYGASKLIVICLRDATVSSPASKQDMTHDPLVRLPSRSNGRLSPKTTATEDDTLLDDEQGHESWLLSRHLLLRTEILHLPSSLTTEANDFRANPTQQNVCSCTGRPLVQADHPVTQAIKLPTTHVFHKTTPDKKRALEECNSHFAARLVHA